MQQKLKNKCGNDLLMIQGQHLALRCHPQKQSVPLEGRGPTVRSLDISLVATLGIIGREGRATYTQLDQTRQSLSI
jgi:hypothetical protein